MGCWNIFKLTYVFAFWRQIYLLPLGLHTKLLTPKTKNLTPRGNDAEQLPIRASTCSSSRYELSTRQKDVIISRAFCPPAHTLPFVCACTYNCFWLVFVGFGCHVCFHFNDLAPGESVHMYMLMCLHRGTATCKHLVNITCSVVKLARRLV